MAKVPPLKSFKREWKNIMQDRVEFSGSTEMTTTILTALKNDGYYVIKDFLSPEQCQSLRDEIDNLIATYSDFIWQDALHSDHRIFGADQISESIKEIYEHPFLQDISARYEGNNKLAGFTLAARLDYKPDNLGSGGGWHRDQASKKQFKAIVYLSDVSDENGPFQYIKGSNRPLDVLLKEYQFGIMPNQNRIEDELAKRITTSLPEKFKSFTASKGTLLLVDTRGIHRGKPIEAGNRYALTNYYFHDRVSPHIEAVLVKTKMAESLSKSKETGEKPE